MQKDLLIGERTSLRTMESANHQCNKRIDLPALEIHRSTPVVEGASTVQTDTLKRW